MDAEKIQRIMDGKLESSEKKELVDKVINHSTNEIVSILLRAKGSCEMVDKSGDDTEEMNSVIPLILLLAMKNLYEDDTESLLKQMIIAWNYNIKDYKR